MLFIVNIFFDSGDCFHGFHCTFSYIFFCVWDLLLPLLEILQLSTYFNDYKILSCTYNYDYVKK